MFNRKDRYENPSQDKLQPQELYWSPQFTWEGEIEQLVSRLHDVRVQLNNPRQREALSQVIQLVEDAYHHPRRF